MWRGMEMGKRGRRLGRTRSWCEVDAMWCGVGWEGVRLGLEMSSRALQRSVGHALDNIIHRSAAE
jgi:hypothetical protein